MTVPKLLHLSLASLASSHSWPIRFLYSNYAAGKHAVPPAVVRVATAKHTTTCLMMTISMDSQRPYTPSVVHG